jgi:hypothetical protein
MQYGASGDLQPDAVVHSATSAGFGNPQLANTTHDARHHSREVYDALIIGKL